MDEKYIIVIDDEENIAELVSIMLGRIGYDSITFNSGMEAITEYTNNYMNIEMVITDLSMSGLTGVDIIKKIISINPNEAILLITGLIKDNILHLVKYSNVEILPKPFTPNELKIMVDAMIINKKKRINAK